MFSLVLDIATTASILFSVAAGLLVVLGVLKIVNFAHGAFLVIGAYSALVVTWLGLNPWFAYPVAFFFGAIIGAVIERLVVRPIYNRPLDAILATWGLSIVIGQLITIGFGREIQFVQTPIAGAITMFGETYSQYRLFLLAMALGINSDRVRFITFCFGSALASLAGALITPLSSVDPNLGIPWLVNAFMLVLVSSVSLASLATAAVVLGGAQVLVSTFVSPVIGGLTIVVLAALILRLRPEGFSRG